MSSAFSGNSTSNCSLPGCQQKESSQTTQHLAAMIFFWLITIVGIMGNTLVIAVVKIIRSMRTTTNYLLANVAVADITTLLLTAIHVILIRAHSPSASQALQSFLCKFFFTNNNVIVTLLVTSLTMTLLAIERYNALVKPMLMSRRLTTDKIAYFISGIWLVAIAMVIPLLVSIDYDMERQNCSLGNAQDEIVIYVDCLFVIMTLIPFTVIAFCYSRIIYGLYFKNTICNNKSERGETREETKEKRRLVILLILLTVVFFIAFIPYGILKTLTYNKISNKSIRIVAYAIQYLTLLNFSVNPFIYAFQSSSYRRSFMFILKKMFCCDTTVEAVELLEMRTRTSMRSV